MRKIYSALGILSVLVLISTVKVEAQRGGSSTRSASSAAARSAGARVTGVAAGSSSSSSGANFDACMDAICISEYDEYKGRCRCSSQLPRIEKILRDIEGVQNKADKMNKELESLMNVSNSASVSNTLGSVYDNINSIEKNAKNMASQKLDATTLVMEGFMLYEEATNKCSSHFNNKSEDDISKMKQAYNVLIEGDCGSYTTILKEKADEAANLLTQSQKNREMFDDQEYKKRNQLDTNSCLAEYDGCMKSQCGENYIKCVDPTFFNVSIKKCEAINFGKCEDTKAVVLVDLKKLVEKAIAKDNVAQSCASAMGQIRHGKCVFEVKYASDRCTTSKCKTSEVKFFNPGFSFRCDDRKGPFTDLVYGCYETCYLISKGVEKRLGTNGNAGAACSGAADVTLPTPEGWGKDGYPTDPELKRAF